MYEGRKEENKEEGEGKSLSHAEGSEREEGEKQRRCDAALEEAAVSRGKMKRGCTKPDNSYAYTAFSSEMRTFGQRGRQGPARAGR